MPNKKHDKKALCDLLKGVEQSPSFNSALQALPTETKLRFAAGYNI